MEFPDYGLVKLNPKDLTGPGVEFFARRVSASAASAALGANIAADQLSSERLYLVSWALQLIPGAAQIALGARMLLEYGPIDIPLWNDAPRPVSFGVSVAVARSMTSPFMVVPGGKGLLFVAEFDVGGVANTLDGFLWGYSFPRGNVLSF